MSDIDKDIENSIEIVKKMKRCSLTGGFDKQTERLKAIFTITAYLESMRENKEDLYRELETYKKIAEKLAIEVENLDDMLSAELGSHTRGYCRIENSCIFNYKRKCSECIIDWARNEVEKDV